MATPALIVTYSRLSGLLNLLNSCNDAGLKTVYVAIDGAQTQEVAVIQQLMLSAIDQFRLSSKMEIKVWHRERNLGVAVSIISAIDWLFKNEDSGVILEDDLIVSKDFFEFTSNALAIFESSSSIHIISGNRYDGGHSSKPVLVSYPQTWGWATWRDKWLNMRPALSERPNVEIPMMRRNVSNYWQVGANRVWSGYVDTWDLLVARWMLINSMKCLLPPRNLVLNVGADAYSTHTKKNVFPIGVPIESGHSIDSSMFENDVSEDLAAEAFLVKEVFRIKLRHYFLQFYKGLSEVRMQRKYRFGSLGERLEAVTIP